MRKELQDKLVASYPGIFADVGGDPASSPIAFGIDCDDGWYGIIDALCAAIKARKLDVVAEQCKEKFGGLRFYLRGGDEFVDGLVEMAEAISFRVCETCGNPGKPRRGGWIKTLCDRCSEKRGT